MILVYTCVKKFSKNVIRYKRIRKKKLSPPPSYLPPYLLSLLLSTLNDLLSVELGERLQLLVLLPLQLHQLGHLLPPKVNSEVQEIQIKLYHGW